jgi:hypothetical protein
VVLDETNISDVESKLCDFPLEVKIGFWVEEVDPEWSLVGNKNGVVSFNSDPYVGIVLMMFIFHNVCCFNNVVHELVHPRESIDHSLK